MQQSRTFLDGVGRLLESRNLGRILTFIVIPILVLVVLTLPPVQIVERIRTAGHTEITAASTQVVEPDGTSVTFPVEGLPEAGSTFARLDSTPRAEFERGAADKELREAAEALPGSLRPRSPVYELNVRGDLPEETEIVIPIPNDSLPYETLDAYNWNGMRWEWLPRQINPDTEMLEVDVNVVPSTFMVVQTSSQLPTVGIELPPNSTLPAEAATAATTLYPAVLTLRGDGGLDGVDQLPDVTDAAYKTVVTVRNYEPDGAPRTDLLANMLIDDGMRQVHINSLAELAASQLYSGVALDYRGVDPPLSADYTRFVLDLAERLHQDGKTLTVFVDPPKQTAEDTWETYGYDWRALGAAADVIVIPGSENPLAYAPGAEVEQMLNWAVGEVDRTKLQLSIPARTVEQAGTYFIPLGYTEALTPLLGQPSVDNTVIEPGQTVQASLTTDIVASPLQFDPATGVSWYRYRDQSGNDRIVYLENAASLANKVALASRFNLNGVFVKALENEDIDPEIWAALRSFASGETPALSATQLATEWKMTNAQGELVAQQTAPLGETVALAVPAEAGTYNLEAGLLSNNQTVGSQGAVAVAVATYTPTPPPTPTPAPTPAVALVQANDTVNLRSGPGTAFGLAGQIEPGQQLKVIGKNQDGTWWQVEDASGKVAWVIADLVTASGPVDTIAVAKDIPAAPQRVASAGSSGGTGGSTAAPAPRAAPAPAGAGTFGYGLQIQPYGGANLDFASNAIRNIGFNWVKWQVPWKEMEGSPGNIGWQDGIVDHFAGQGLNILASIVKAPTWARPAGTDLGVEGPPADPQTFANFLGAYAGRYCGKVQAIEVWNEQNLHYEWGNEPLDPARYMELLKRAYGSIKAACPQMIVVSGALTPAGNVGSLAIDDFQYLEAMYRNGLAQYSDAIGAHPSGYNVPADLTWEQACDFINRDGASFRGACDSPHHSWSARSTIEGYRNIMLRYGDRNKRVWPTEFGWAAGGALHPSYGYANDNSRDEQARWTTQFYQWMRSTGFVGPAFLWNLNFGMTNPGTELAQWGILDAGGNGYPVYQALQAMPK